MSYIDIELTNRYQCATDYIKEQSICTDYAYDAKTKICSLFDDSVQIIDINLTKLVNIVR